MLVELGIVEVFAIPIAGHVQLRRANVAAALGIAGVGHVGDGEAALGNRGVNHEPHIGIVRIPAIHGERILAAGDIVPHGVHDGILHGATFQVHTGGKEGFLVGELNVRTQAVAEVRRKVRVTQGHAQRIGIVQNRH